MTKIIYKSRNINKNYYKTMEEMILLLKKLFTSTQIAHSLHLGIQGEASFAGHVALEEYYDKLPELIDDLAEVYQGQYGIIDMNETMIADEDIPSDFLDYFSDLVNFVKGQREKIVSDENQHLNNQFDDIISLLYKLIYKLTNLK